MDWIAFKKTFTQEQEDALWQYFIDHSRIQKNGFLGIMFYVRNVDDFWKRVHARHTGDFKRYDVLKKEEKQNDVLSEAMSHRVEHIHKKGTLKQKLYLWLYAFTRDEIKKIPVETVYKKKMRVK